MKRGYDKFFVNGTEYTFIDTSKTRHFPVPNKTCYYDCWSYDTDGPSDLRMNYPIIDLQFEHAGSGRSIGTEISYKDVPSKVKAAYTRWEKFQ